MGAFGGELVKVRCFHLSAHEAHAVSALLVC
jgi:hypothetical protein